MILLVCSFFFLVVPIGAAKRVMKSPRPVEGLGLQLVGAAFVAIAVLLAWAPPPAGVLTRVLTTIIAAFTLLLLLKPDVVPAGIRRLVEQAHQREAAANRARDGKVDRIAGAAPLSWVATDPLPHGGLVCPGLDRLLVLHEDRIESRARTDGAVNRTFAATMGVGDSSTTYAQVQRVNLVRPSKRTAGRALVGAAVAAATDSVWQGLRVHTDQRGILQIGLAGAPQQSPSILTIGEAADDPFVIDFAPAEQALFEQACAYLQRRMASPGAPQPPSVGSLGLGEQLRELDALRKDGVISQDDFDRKKSQLLGLS